MLDDGGTVWAPRPCQRRMSCFQSASPFTNARAFYQVTIAARQKQDWRAAADDDEPEFYVIARLLSSSAEGGPIGLEFDRALSGACLAKLEAEMRRDGWWADVLADPELIGAAADAANIRLPT